MRRSADPCLAAGVALLAAACAAPGRPGAAPPRAGGAGAEPVIRVGIAVHTDSVAVASDGWLWIGDPATGRAIAVTDSGETWTVVRDAGDRLRVVRPDGARSQPHGSVRVEPLSGTLRVNGTGYRGALVIIPGRRGGMTAVNVVGLEDYLLGVVAAEIGPRPISDLEAVKAQAVAARTYAIAYLGARDSLGFDVFADVGDQVYRGLDGEAEVPSRAVRETRGVVATYGGRPIETYYHSTCGGATARIEDVWPRPARPYLVSVSDRVPGAEERYYCEGSPHFRWETRWSLDDLRTVLAETLPPRTGVLPESLGVVTDVRVVDRTAEGRARKIEIRTTRLSVEVWGNDIRWVLEPRVGQPLRSTYFVETWVRDGGAAELRLRGGGWGHGVGLCQWGAIGRARRGQSYEEILTAYFPGIELQRWY
jgi:stage II sporulation protein D